MIKIELANGNSYNCKRVELKSFESLDAKAAEGSTCARLFIDPDTDIDNLLDDYNSGNFSEFSIIKNEKLDSTFSGFTIKMNLVKTISDYDDELYLEIVKPANVEEEVTEETEPTQTV